jgi:transposase-like protein
MTPEKKRRSRRKYTQDFKDDAVRLILEGTPVKDAAGSDLAMSPKEMAAEIATLRKQLKRSELHREILKKAVTIFSQDPRNGLSS